LEASKGGTQEEVYIVTIATKPAQRVGRAPVQRLVEYRMDEQVAANAVANQARQLVICRDEIGKAAAARDRATVIRLADMQSALIDSIQDEATGLLKLIRQHTPAFVGEVPA